MSNRSFNGKVAIISGSSRGIGKVIAKLPAARGAVLIINGRNQERLAKAEKEIKTKSINVLSVCVMCLPRKGAGTG